MEALNVDKSTRAWEFAKINENRRAMGMLNPVRENNEGMFILGGRRDDN